MNPAKKKKVSFREAIIAIHWLLSTVNEKRWISHVDKHLNGKTAGYRDVYGGMGSFNDLVLCRTNNHKIDEAKEPLANELLRCLSSIAYTASKVGDLTPASAIKACGNVGAELSGWRCRDCGYARVSTLSLNGIAAYGNVRKAIERGINKGLFVDHMKLLWDTFSKQAAVDKFKGALNRSDVELSEKHATLNQCAKCNSRNTCVYRWNFMGRKFTPSPDNLAVNLK